MNTSWHIPRRTFLRGLGTMMALPALDAMIPGSALAAAAGKKSPVRMAYIYTPNGQNMQNWTPATLGADYEVTPILEPLKSHRQDFALISGLAHTKARANGDGPGDHARANATFLTGCQAHKTAGADIRVGVSVDQLAAQKVGQQTKLPSLEVGCDRGRSVGSCDSGYSCAYQFNFAWKSATQPIPPEIDPRQVFERLFAGVNKAESAEARARRENYQKSVLDFVLEDAKSLQSKLGTTDQRKLDEYLTAVRELEQRIEHAEKFASALPDFSKPTGVPTDYEAHIRLMYDLMALAFQTDSTRVATFLVAHDGSNRSYANIEVHEGHHDLSHHGGNAVKLEKIAKINTFHATQLAYFLDKLKSVREGDRTLLDNCMIVYGSGIADGNAHAHHDLPVLVAGRGGGAIRTGVHREYPKETPMANLYLSLLDMMGAPAKQMGDSTGKLADLASAVSSGPCATAERLSMGKRRA
ncbi:MAG: DUF1552 domain-containing protein [Verrucomicrobia bacterium]|nr:DUF1552 domain-containing protein [Verrucomicrobiota bacterium]